MMTIKDWAMLVSVVVLFVIFGILVTTNQSLKSKVKELQTQNTLYQAANQKCEQDVKNANDGLTQLKADSARREKTAQDALQKAQAMQSYHEQQRSVINAAPAPQKGMECVAAQQLVDSYLKRTRK